MLHTVALVSCLRDLAVNRVSVPAIIANIPAGRYLVVVPEADVAAFKAGLPGEVHVVGEEALLPGCTLRSIAARLPPAVAWRAGWYLQQLLKIEALRCCPPDSEALLWDGDTVPLRPIEFKDAAGRIGFYTSDESHSPYFVTTQRLLGLGKIAPRSFIAQCMYVRARWIAGLLSAIEARTGRAWIDAILGAVTGAAESEFSEYETIGTFVLNSCPAEVFFIERRWFRWGAGYLGRAESMDATRLQRLSRIYDFAAFEHWDGGPRGWLRSRRVLYADAGAQFLLTQR